MPKQKKDPGAPKRALSSYMFFSQERRPQLKAQHPEWPFGDFAKVMGAEWRQMDENQRKPYTEKANTDKVRFETENKKYQAKLKRRANAAKKKEAARAAAGLPPLTAETPGGMKINTPAKGKGASKAKPKTTKAGTKPVKNSPVKGKPTATKPKAKTAGEKAKGTAKAAPNKKKAPPKKKPAAKPRQKKSSSADQQQFLNTGFQQGGGFNYNSGMDNNYQQSYQDYSHQFQGGQQYQQQQYQQQDYSNYNSSDHVYYNNQIHNWKNWPPVRKGDWGMVYVCGGPLAGHFVYYEDDQGSDQAIINIGGPMTPPTYAVNLSELRKPPPVHSQVPQQQQQNSMLQFP